jgi:hypothetical protein
MNELTWSPSGRHSTANLRQSNAAIPALNRTHPNREPNLPKQRPNVSTHRLRNLSLTASRQTSPLRAKTRADRRRFEKALHASDREGKEGKHGAEVGTSGVAAEARLCGGDGERGVEGAE